MHQDNLYTNGFSIVDYLTDELTLTTNRSPAQIIRQLKKKISRDLENLLNAKKRCLSLPENMSALDETILNYGMDDDFMSVEADSPAYFDFLCQQLETTIKSFETRLTNVSVTYDKEENKNLDNREIIFKIQATLLSAAINEPVVFDFMLRAENEIAVSVGDRN